MFVAARAVDLATNFATGPACAVHVYIGGARANRGQEFIEFPGADAPFIREVCNINCRDGAGYRCWWRRAGLSACGSIAEVRAKEHTDRASYGFLSKVNVSLLNSAFEVSVTKLPRNLRVIIADSRSEGSITGR